jgi:hypothetical protein
LLSYFFFKDQSFINGGNFILQSGHQLIKNITSYGINPFNNAKGFAFTCTSFGYYICDTLGQKLVKFSSTWSYLTWITYSIEVNFVIAVNNSNTLEIFYSSRDFVAKLNSNLNYLSQHWYTKASYQGLFYNKTGDYILACSAGYNLIYFLSRNNLAMIKYISTSPYTPTDIKEYNGVLYVGTFNSTVLIIENEVIVSNFMTTCPIILSLSIDILGNIAVVCNSNVILMYSKNGTYSGISWASPIAGTSNIAFDNTGNIILSAAAGVFIYN